MKRALALAAMLIAAPAGAEVSTKRIAINWEVLPTGPTQTANMRAYIPGGMLTFVRDVEGVSTDSFAIHLDGGFYCNVLVMSTDPFSFGCGSLKGGVYQLGRENGSPLILQRIAPEPEPEPEEKRVVPLPRKRVRA